MITVYGFIGQPSHELIEAVAEADLVVGGRRHLDALKVDEDRRIVLGRIGPAITQMQANPEANIVVIASGDPLFYGVVRRIRAAGLRVRVIPALTSLQLAFAAVALPWDDALLVSLHGNDPEPGFEAARTHPKVGLLTDPTNGFKQIVEACAGLGKYFVLAEQLGTDTQRVRVFDESQARTVGEIKQPNVVLVLDHHPDSIAALGEQSAISGCH